jgi:NADP-dependent 3-hydroxy acid dehydrogenase YdfG
MKRAGRARERIHVVTGATSGIGEAVARRFCARSKPVLAIGRHTERLIELERAFPDLIRTHRIDLLDDSEIGALAAELEAAGSEVAALVHSSGEHFTGALAVEAIGDLDRMYRSNVRAQHLLTQALVPALKRGRGYLIFINSSAGKAVRLGAGAYAASQYALRALADAWRLELNSHGVRVLSVHPGRTNTPRISRLFASEGRAYQPELLLQPDDIARVVEFAVDAPPGMELTEISVRPSVKSY